MAEATSDQATVANADTRNSQNWQEDFPTLTTPARELLENYAGIPSDQLETQVRKIRQEAFEIYPYPCIGNFRFLDLSLHAFPVHDEVVSRIKDGAKYLDLGCCFGQEIRYLVSKGCPSENMYGADLRDVFIRYGYELFRDQGTLKATFLAPANIFEPEPLSKLHGKIDIVNASSFFHLFSWDDSIIIAKRVVEILRPMRGGLIVGRQVGSTGQAGYKDDKDANSAFRHNEDSWKRMWREVGQLTQSEWDVDFWWDPSRPVKEDETVNGLGQRGFQRFCYTIRRR